MTFEQTVMSLPVEIIREFKLALRSGYWSNGLKLTEYQKQICESAVFTVEQDIPAQIH